MNKEKEFQFKERYLIKLNLDLLDLGAIEMDQPLWELANRIEGTEVWIEDEKGTKKKFRINKEEHLLQGRGIKGFFKSYMSKSITLEVTAANTWKICPVETMDKSLMKTLDRIPNSKKRIISVLQSMEQMESDHPEWFSLYWKVRNFSISGDFDELLSIPYIRDLQLFEYQMKTVKTVIHRFRGRVLLCDDS